MEKRRKPKPKKGKYEINDEEIFALDYTLEKPEEEKPKRGFTVAPEVEEV